MLGHDDPGVEGEVEFVAGFVEAIDEDVFCTGVAEKGKTTKAGEGDETDAVFTTVHLLSEGLGRLWVHIGKVTNRATDLGLERSVRLGWEEDGKTEGERHTDLGGTKVSGTTRGVGFGTRGEMEGQGHPPSSALVVYQRQRMVLGILGWFVGGTREGGHLP